MNDYPFEKTVAEIMVREVQTISQEESVQQAAELFAEHSIRHLVVTDDVGRVVGVFSDRDLMQHTIYCLSHEESPGVSPVSGSIAESPVTVNIDTPLSTAAGILANRKIGCLPVLDHDGGLCGIVSTVDLLQHYGEQADRPALTGNLAGENILAEETLQLLNDFEMAKMVYESSARDLTDLVEKLAEEKKIAKAAIQVKQEFLANMSHEIRTPMTAILGFTEILLENLTDEQNLAAANTIKLNGEHMLCLINDILDLSKVEAGKLEVERIACSPISLIADVASLMRLRAEEKGLGFLIRHDGPLPSIIQTDPTRLRQILINIVGNAIKFTQAGSVEIVTRLLEGPHQETKLQFDVTDSGIGIAAEKVESLFHPFTQADNSTTRQFGGTGLGLTICKRLVELLDGDISVVSTVSKGSTFSFTVATGKLGEIPLNHNPHQSHDLWNQSKVGNSGEGSLQDCRILLAEDGPDNQRLISLLLKKVGADVTVAKNGRIAVELASTAIQKNQPFDVILMDMQMPILDGYAATRQLRSKGYSLPILALTAHAMSGDRQKCLDAGCDDFLTKPVDRTSLIQLVAHYANVTALSQAPPVC